MVVPPDAPKGCAKPLVSLGAGIELHGQRAVLWDAGGPGTVDVY
jgi:hypothetical protein